MLLLAVLQVIMLSSIYGYYNITIDDSSTSINYVGILWEVADSSQAYGGSHHYADSDVHPDDRTATAAFTFSGTAIYYMAPRWPYTVNTVVSLDSGPSSLIDMTDPSNSQAVGSPPTVVSQVLWGQFGLADTEHTLVMSMANSGMYVVVDALIYTVVDPASTTPLPAASSSSHGSFAYAPGSHAMTPTARIIITAVGAAIGFALFLLAAVVICRRQRKHIVSGAHAVGYQPSNTDGEVGEFSSDHIHHPPLTTSVAPEIPSLQSTQSVPPPPMLAFSYNDPQPPLSTFDYGQVPPTTAIPVPHDAYTPTSNLVNQQPTLSLFPASVSPHLASGYAHSALSRSTNSSPPGSRMSLTPLEGVVPAPEGTRLATVMEGFKDTSSPASMLPQSLAPGNHGYSGIYSPQAYLTAKEKYMADQKQFDSSLPEGSKSPAPTYARN